MANDSFNINSIRINVLYDGKEVLTKDFERTSEPITIGREQDVEIPLEDTFVSKKHCSIRFKGSSVILEDLGSRNGTIVNGRKAASMELISGDKIQLGKTTIIVIIPEKKGEIFESKTKELSFSDTGEFSINELEEKRAVKEEITRERKKEAPDTSPAILSDDLGNILTGHGISKPSKMEDYYEEEDDDDDEDEDFQYYPLLPKIIGSDSKQSQASLRGSSDEIIEVIQSPGDDVQEIESLKKGESFWIMLDEKNYRFLKYSGRGECQVFFKENFKGHIYSEGRKIPLSKLMTSEASVRGNRFKSIFKSGDLAEIDTGSHKYYLRFAQSVELPDKTKSKTERSFLFKILGSSIAIHLAVMIILSIYTTFVKASEDNARSQEMEDRFVKLDLKDLEPKPPEPTPAPTAVSTPAPQPIAERAQKVKQPKITVKTAEKKSTRIIGVKKSRRIGGGGGNVNVAAVGVLASLGGLTTDSTSSTNVIRAVSNLDAVKAPRGTQSTFSVSGLIGKSVSGDAKIVRISGPATKGVGGVDKQFGAIGTLGGRKGRGVGGIVVGDVPTFEIGIKGSLSRQQILEVVQKHAGELSYCYEKALGDDPNLEGKLLMFWEINSDGRVGDVRIKTASLRSTSVNRCVMTNIKTWQFPKPKGGGLVQVTFPFVFNAASF